MTIITKMQSIELRQEPRDPIICKAQLYCEDAWVPCLIQNVSPHGFGILSTRNFFVGQLCELRCEPYPEQTLQCRIVIRHASESYLGAVVTEMDEVGRRLCMQLMRDYHSDRKSRNQ